MFAYELQKQIIEIGRYNKQQYYVTEAGHEIEDRVRETQENLNRSDQLLNNKYREYRDKILQAKIKLRE